MIDSHYKNSVMVLYHPLKEPWDKHAPMRECIKTVRSNQPWFDQDAKKLKLKRRLAEKHWLNQELLQTRPITCIINKCYLRHLYQSKKSYINTQRPRKIPTPAHLGSSTTGITNTTVQASQPASQQHIQLTPLLVPPLSPIPPYSSPTNTIVGGAHQFFFLMVSTHICPKYPPSPYLQQVLHQCHLGKFSQIFCLV